jgi:hypothetical protein
MEDFFFQLFTINKLIAMHPVQLPLHEPYFDLTPIRVTHTKITLNHDITIYIK